MLNETIERKAELILKYLRGELSWEEQQELDRWLAVDTENKALLESITGFGDLTQALADYAINKSKIWDQIGASIPLKQ
jgi:anti-sigma factor RsiW